MLFEQSYQRQHTLGLFSFTIRRAHANLDLIPLSNFRVRNTLARDRLQGLRNERHSLPGGNQPEQYMVVCRLGDSFRLEP